MFALILAASAAIMERPLTLDELAARSDRLVVGEIVATQVVESAGALVTVAQLQSESGERVQVRSIGGCTPDICYTVAGAPTLVVGDSVAVFLTGDRIVGFSQGLFHVVGADGIRAEESAFLVGALEGRTPIAALRRAAAAHGK